MPTTASPYAARISQIVPTANARHVEAWMRDAAGGVLDNMSNGQFRAEALACARLARMQPELSEQLAQSYGI